MEEVKQVTLNLDSSTWEILKALPAQAREAFVLYAVKNSVNSDFYKTMTAITKEQVETLATADDKTPSAPAQKKPASTSWDSF